MTCVDCNSKGGRNLDYHAIHEEQLRRFVAGKPFARNPVHLSIDGVVANAELSQEGEVNLIRVLPGNPPGRIDELRKSSQNLGPDKGFQLVFRRRYVPQRAKISCLRSGYLAAFANLGYRYIGRSVLQPVRNQIEDPSNQMVEGYIGFDSQIAGRQVGIIRQPEWARGVVVTIDGRIILLPLLDEDFGFYSRVGQGPFQIRAQSLGWPTGPEFRFDYLTTSQLSALVGV